MWVASSHVILLTDMNSNDTGTVSIQGLCTMYKTLDLQTKLEYM